MSTFSDNNERSLYMMLLGFLLMTVLSALLYQGPIEALSGFLRIQQHPARLINDFTQVGGIGAALLNASAVAGISLLLTWAVGGVQLSGPTIAAFFTLFGFGLFGKTPLNILPVLAGVWIASKVAGKTYQEYILIALFGTALGPLASFFVLEMGFAGPLGILVGASAGLLAGILLPAAAMAMLHLHQGYNLYNMGLTCGFIGLFAAGVIRASRGDLTIQVVWLSEPDPLLRL
ncbi:MAG: DUF1576 domain-containing protein, partial [Spirochaetales bacterium]|nr:DUF1576 domain-containing protein [Spirochaetales bacterium]